MMPAGLYRDELGINRGPPGLHRESIKMFNASGMNRESPGRTGNDRRGTGNNRDGTGNNQDGTVTPPGPVQTPTELRQRHVGAPVNTGRIPV
ncbi:hypothetical protein DPMN_100619 [Dreissena polymorpha]|uniref:Uncharacterized protein n=1 Tax=Dreissena polymorpha TaxID=45954 RepID=A0A9D4R9B7_DREPO|nr:hypothetical protein DPMN_100542 [Dreissena polymorpha]KAH3858000.1 hypothetical protein DPMN_100619 [Dreissena polymorpha]